MIFANRTEAGQALAVRLIEYENRDDVIVLGAPRGGVPVAFEVATQLKVPLDVFVLRKLGVPAERSSHLERLRAEGFAFLTGILLKDWESRVWISND